MGPRTVYGDNPGFHYNRSFPNGRSRTINANNGDHWTTFWKQGHITTFGPSKPENYDGVVLDFWKDKFRELPTGARILDIATGNGAIATLAAEFGIDHEKGFVVAATDLAEIQTDRVGAEKTSTARKSIEFHSQTPCEKQPFDDDSFDLVTSQFGFEYSDIASTLREVRRVLVPGGRFVAVSHHDESELIIASRTELDIYALAMDEHDVFSKLIAYHAALGALDGSREEVAGKIKAASVEARATLDTLRELQLRYPENACAGQLDGTVRILARPRYREAEGRIAAAELAREDFSAARARLVDMVNAAMTNEDTEKLAVTAKESGFSSVHCLRLYDENDSLVGWQIHMR